ncbi:MAG: hypothetical protein C0508_28785, partial [Cyanobacteria bacterium PR.023]|nr:hypothetical protein [Cyanobacteria bacterium PR.023]
MLVKESSARLSGKKASVVKMSATPQWLINILRKEYPDELPRADFNAFLILVKRLFDGVGIDHWGTTEWHGLSNCFVTEPYGIKEGAVQKLKETGRRLGFAVVYDPLSYHMPGSCERVLIFPLHLSPLKTYHPAVLAAVKEAGCEIAGDTLKTKLVPVLRQKEEDLAAYVQWLNHIHVAVDYFLCRPVIIEKLESGYTFYCVKKHAAKLKAAQSTIRKICKDMRIKP